MRMDLNNSNAQDFVNGAAVGALREAVICRAEWVAENPFPPKDPGQKVSPLLCPFLSRSHHMLSDSCLSHVTDHGSSGIKSGRRGQGGGAPFFSAGMGGMDHDFCHLWNEDLEVDMMPEDVRLRPTSEALAHR